MQCKYLGIMTKTCLLLKHASLASCLYSLYILLKKKRGFNIILKNTSKIGKSEAVVSVYFW